MGDERGDIRTSDEKIKREVRGMKNGGWGRRDIQIRLRFGLMGPFIIHAYTELLLRTRRRPMKPTLP